MNLRNFLIAKKTIIAITIASLIGFLFMDLLIRGFFIKNVDSIISWNFLFNLIMFILLVLVYYELIIKLLSAQIEKLMGKYEKNIFWIVLISFLILGILFHYKYNLFDQKVMDFLEDILPSWIKNVK